MKTRTVKSKTIEQENKDINVSDAIFDLSQSIDEEKKNKLFEYILYRFEKMNTHRAVLDEKVRRWEKIYDSIPEDKDEDWQSNLFVPYTYSIIQTILPRLYAAIFGNINYIGVSAKSSEFLHSEKKIATYLQQKFDLMRLKQKKASDIILAALKYPYAITKTVWKYSVDNFTIKKQIRVMNKYLTFKKEKKQVVTYDDPDIELIDWFDFWIDPNALNIDDAKDCIHRTWRDYTYLKQMEKLGIYTNVESLKNSNMGYRDDINSRGGKDADTGYSEIEILEYWGQYDINGDGEDESIVVTIANREKIIRIRENDLYYHKKPFVQYKILPEPFKFEGKSLIEILESLQLELNSVRNQRMDNTNLSIKKLFKVLDGANIDLNNIFSGPGNVMFVEDMDDIQEMRVSDVTPSLVQAEPMIKDDMQQVSGALDYTGKRYNTTATGISIVTSEMATRFKQMVVAIANSLEEQFYLIFQFLKQFKSEDEMIRIIEKDKAKFEKMTIKEIEGDYYFSINVKDLTVNKQLQQQQWLNLLNIIGRFDFVNVKEFVKSVLDVFEVKNVDKILDYKEYQKEVEKLQITKLQHLLNTQTLQQIIQQKLQLQQAQMQQAIMEEIQRAQQPGPSEQQGGVIPAGQGGMEAGAGGIPTAQVPTQQAGNQIDIINKIKELGLIRSPVDATLEQPIKKIPELERLKQEVGLNRE